MRRQNGNPAFWKRLMAWAEGFESTSYTYHQHHLIALGSELDEVNKRLKQIENNSKDK